MNMVLSKDDQSRIRDGLARSMVEADRLAHTNGRHSANLRREVDALDRLMGLVEDADTVVLRLANEDNRA